MSLAPRLDSSLPDQRWQRCLGPAIETLRSEPSGVTALFDAHHQQLRQWTSPLDALAWLDGARSRLPPDQTWVGYLSYDLGRYFEQLPSRALDDLELPLLIFSRHEILPSVPVRDPAASTRMAGPLTSNLPRDTYLHAVTRAIDYIAAGDIFQVNLSQRFQVQAEVSPTSLYARIQNRHPACYAALLDYGDFALVCNSPELFLRISGDQADNRIILTRPIKGTRPRRPGMDRKLELSIKDAAELNMIIDLERNDLGRICQIGSVRVTQPRTIETHPTVYHGVATVEGVLRPGTELVDILRATFPGGSITGAPKIRAMQIIDELEPHRRGPYCGAIGYLDADGTIEFNIAIRTMILRHGNIYVPVGGGIVADSVPEAEYDETLVKAHAAFDTLGIGLEAVGGKRA